MKHTNLDKSKIKKHRPPLREIPLDRIGEGMSICIKNCKRHFDDSMLLWKNKRHQSAITSLLLAIEEFGKAKLLLEHFKKNEPVPIDKIKTYFRSHELRLTEFADFLKGQTIKTSDPNKIGRKGSSTGSGDQAYKERITYVDWKMFNWHDPLRDERYENFGENHDVFFYTDKFEKASDELKTALENLADDKSYIKAVTSPVVDVPTMSKIGHEVDSYFHKSMQKRFSLNEKSIKLYLRPDKAVTHDSIADVKKILQERFPKWNVDVGISDV